jgi:hypothetical protein
VAFFIVGEDGQPHTLQVLGTKSQKPQRIGSNIGRCMIKRPDGKPAAKTVCREWSIHPEDNDLFRLPGFDPFKNPSCRMHATDHGIFKRLLDLSIFIISRQKANIKREFDDR